MLPLSVGFHDESWVLTDRLKRSELGPGIFSSDSHFVLSQQQLLSLLSLTSSWKMVPTKLTDWATEEPQPAEGRMWLKLCSDSMASLRKSICFFFFGFGLGIFWKPFSLGPFPPSVLLRGFAGWTVRTTEIQQWGPPGTLAHYPLHLQTPVCTIIVLFLLLFK